MDIFIQGKITVNAAVRTWTFYRSGQAAMPLLVLDDHDMSRIVKEYERQKRESEWLLTAIEDRES